MAKFQESYEPQRPRHVGPSGRDETSGGIGRAASGGGGVEKVGAAEHAGKARPMEGRSAFGARNAARDTSAE